MLVLWITFCAATVTASIFSDMIRQQNDLLFKKIILDYFRHGERSMGSAQCATHFDSLVQAIENVIILEEEEMHEAQCRFLNLSRCVVEGLVDKLDSTVRATEVAESLENFLKLKCEPKNDLKMNEMSMFLGEEEMPVLKTTKGLLFFLSSFRHTLMNRIEEQVPTFFMNLLMMEEMKDCPVWLSKIKYIIKDEFEDSRYKSFKKQISHLFDAKLLELLKNGPVVDNHFKFPVDDLVKDLSGFNGWGTNSVISYLYGLQTLRMVRRYPEVNVADDLMSIVEIGFSQEQKVIIWNIASQCPLYHRNPLPFMEMAHNLSCGVYGLSEKTFFERLWKLSEAGARVEKSFQIPTLGTVFDHSSITDSKDEIVTNSTLSKTDSIKARQNNKNSSKIFHHAAPNVCVLLHGIPIHPHAEGIYSEQNVRKIMTKRNAAKNLNFLREKNITSRMNAPVAIPFTAIKTPAAASNVANAQTSSQQEVSPQEVSPPKKSSGIRVTVPTPEQQQAAFKLFGESVHPADSINNAPSFPVLAASAPSERPDELSGESIEEKIGNTMSDLLQESREQSSTEGLEDSFDKSINDSSENVEKNESSIISEDEMKLPDTVKAEIKSSDKIEEKIKPSDSIKVEIKPSNSTDFSPESVKVSVSNKKEKNKDSKKKNVKKENSPPKKQVSKSKVEEGKKVVNAKSAPTKKVPIVAKKSKISSQNKKKEVFTPPKVQEDSIKPEVESLQPSRKEFKLHESRRTIQKSLSINSMSLKSKLSKSFSSYDELNKALLSMAHGTVPKFSEVDEQLAIIHKKNLVFNSLDFLFKSVEDGVFLIDLLVSKLETFHKKWEEKKIDSSGKTFSTNSFKDFASALNAVQYFGIEGFDTESFINSIISFSYDSFRALTCSSDSSNNEAELYKRIYGDFLDFMNFFTSSSSLYSQHHENFLKLIEHTAEVGKLRLLNAKLKAVFDLLPMNNTVAELYSHPPSFLSWKPSFLLKAFAPSRKLADQPKDCNGLMIYLRTLSAAYSSLNYEHEVELLPTIRFFSLFTERTILGGSLDFDLIKKISASLFLAVYADFVDSSRYLSAEHRSFIKIVLEGFENMPSETVYPYLQAVGFSIWSHEFSNENPNEVLKYRLLNDLLNVKQLASFWKKDNENSGNLKKLLLLLSAKKFNQNDALALLQTVSPSNVNFSKFVTDVSLKNLKNELTKSSRMISLAEFCSTLENPTETLYLEFSPAKFSPSKFRLVSNLQLSSLCRFMDGGLWNFLESDLLNIVSMLPSFRRVRIPSSTLDLASFKFTKIVNGEKEFLNADFLFETGITAYPHPKLFTKSLSNVLEFIGISLDSKVAFSTSNDPVAIMMENSSWEPALLDKMLVSWRQLYGEIPSVYEISRKVWLKKEFKEFAKEFYAKKEELQSSIVDFAFDLGKDIFSLFSHELASSEDIDMVPKLYAVAEFFSISRNFHVALNSSEEDLEENILKALVCFEFISSGKYAEDGDLHDFYFKLNTKLKELIYFGDFKKIQLFAKDIAESILVISCNQNNCDCPKVNTQKRASLALKKIKADRDKSMILILEEMVLPFHPGVSGLFVSPSFSKDLCFAPRNISFSKAEMALLLKYLDDHTYNIDLKIFEGFQPCARGSLERFNILVNDEKTKSNMENLRHTLNMFSNLFKVLGFAFYDPELLEIYVFWHKNVSNFMNNFEEIHSADRFSTHFFDFLLKKKKISILVFKQLHTFNHIFIYCSYLNLLLKSRDIFIIKPRISLDKVDLNCEKISVDTVLGKVEICKSFIEKYAKAKKSDYFMMRGDFLELMEILVDAKIFERTSFKNSPTSVYLLAQKYKHLTSAKAILLRTTDYVTLTEDPHLVLSVLEVLGSIFK